MKEEESRRGDVVEGKFIGCKCRKKETMSYEGKCCRGEMSQRGKYHSEGNVIGREMS